MNTPAPADVAGEKEGGLTIMIYHIEAEQLVQLRIGGYLVLRHESLRRPLRLRVGHVWPDREVFRGDWVYGVDDAGAVHTVRVRPEASFR